MYNHREDLSRGSEYVLEAMNCFDTARAKYEIDYSEKNKLDDMLKHLVEVKKMADWLLRNR